MPVTDTVDQYLQSLDAEARRVSETEWGLTVEAAGWPLHIGVAWRDGLLRAQAEVLGPDQLNDHELLFRNRGLVLVRYAHTSAGDVYVHGELPPELVSSSWLDRLLGMLVDAAVVARHRAQAGPTSRASDATTSSGSSAS
jgi:hypothetical protein